MDSDILHRQIDILKNRSGLLAIHLREIANNERYQRHKGMLNARMREIAHLRQLLDEIEQELRR